MAYWCAAQTAPNQLSLALHCLGLAGYEVYCPRLREYRRSYGRKIEVRPPLFVGYVFVLIELQWHSARWSPGVIRLVENNGVPARVSDSVIAEIRAREVGGLVELPSPPTAQRAGDPVRILTGPFQGCVGLFSNMKPRERVEVLLSLLGGQTRVELAKNAIEAIC